MKKRFILKICILVALISSNLSASEFVYGDKGDGTYCNPIIHADYSDPDVVRVDDDFYMTASSFTSFPGLPILHSADLVNWSIIGHALSEYAGDRFMVPEHGKGVWAPAIRFHKDEFYIYWGDPDDGIYMVRAEKPAGPWSQPQLVLAGKGIIDPCPFWDDDGKAYIVHGWAGSRAGGFNSVLTIREMSLDGTKVSSQGKHVFDGHDKNHTLEGPKLYKKDGMYYIFAPAGGVSTGWQLALRANDIYGPYETRVVMAQGKTVINGPHQGGLIDTQSGQSWFIHFQDKEAYGRVVHLQPVNWRDGWPVIGADNDKDGCGEPVSEYVKPQVSVVTESASPATSDDFDSDHPGMQWQWQAREKLSWYVQIRNSGFLRLVCQVLPDDTATLWDAGNILLQKFPATDFTATTKVCFTPSWSGKHAGLVIMGRDYAALELYYDGNDFIVARKMCIDADKGGKETTIATVKLPQGGPGFAESVTYADGMCKYNCSLYFRVKVTGPDAMCRFSYSIDDKDYIELGESFKARVGGWIGAKAGIYSVADVNARNGGYADFDWFRIER